KLLVMPIKQRPTLRVWPDEHIVGRWITEIIPVRSENLPRGANRNMLLPRDDHRHLQIGLTLSKPPPNSLLGQSLRAHGRNGENIWRETILTAERARVAEQWNGLVRLNGLHLRQNVVRKQRIPLVCPAPRQGMLSDGHRCYMTLNGCCELSGQSTV